MAVGGNIRAGELRHVITLQTKQSSRDVQGGFTPLSWTNTVTGIRARISPKTGQESIFADSVRALMTHSIICRAQTSTIYPDQRIVFGSRAFNILAVVLVDEIKHVVNIAAVEIPGAAGSVSGAAAVPEAWGMYSTEELSFLTTQDIAFTMPSGKRFYPDSFEVVPTQLTGAISVQPTVRCGISGSLNKYRNSLTTVLTALYKRQTYSSLSANEGETNMHLGISVAASGPTVFKGILTVTGKLVG